MVSGVKAVSNKADLKIQKRLYKQGRQIVGSFKKAEHNWRKAKEMASDKTMTQAIAQAVVEATKVAILAVREQKSPVNTNKQHKISGMSGPVVKQPTFD